ncbi:MAG: DUF2281 domain-containing protein [Anaerolineae bacterium]|nr:DUF2281 domain-containing protein [Anaerolineae bacterium]
MLVEEQIQQHLRRLPDALKAEVLDFVEYLLLKTERATQQAQDIEPWSAFSLAAAMRGMEDEDGPEYSLDDLNVTF